MKFCRFLCYVIVLQIFNSCCASEIVTKTEALHSNVEENSNIIGNETVEVQHAPDAGKASTLTVESEASKAIKDTPAEIKENVGKASQIQSSFEDVPKAQVSADEVAINEKLSGVLNQGTLSQELPDAGTLEVISLVDSATTDLHHLASSASANAPHSAEDPTINTTTGSLPPIVILPAGDADHNQINDKVEEKTDPASIKPVKLPTADPPPPPIIRAEPKVIEPISKTVEAKSDEDVESIVNRNERVSEGSTSEPPIIPSPGGAGGSNLDLVAVPTSEIPQEEIPSFSEWTQKQLEEAEKKKVQNKTTSPPPSRVPAPSKVRSKNYASPDCGAKIVATNPEAENPNGVLSNSKDEYLINKCSTQRMWLIIELCEAVQAKKIELANFELFSSSPKDFSVSLSHNYPSRDWSSVGQFTAKDERTVQSFNLHPHLFGKFLKVEFNSHYGREHFCCTSLIRVYGTSEFEVLETENEGHSGPSELDDEDEDEQPIGADIGKPAKNLFGHATDAVYTIVRKAAEVLVKSGESQNQSQILEQKNSTALIPANHLRPQHCNTLRHLVVCNNCSEDFYNLVYHLLSCQAKDLQGLIESPFVFDGINNSQLCSFYGLDFIAKRNLAIPLRLRHEDQLDQAGYLAAMLPAEYISALCNILAVLEGKVVLNNSYAALTSQGESSSSQLPKDSRDSNFKNLLIEHQSPPTCSVDVSFTSSQPRTIVLENTHVASSAPGSYPEPIGSEIKPTRTLTKDISVVVEKSSTQGHGHKSDSTPEVIATVVSPTLASVEPSVGAAFVNEFGAPSSDKTKSSSAAPVISSESLSPDQHVFEVPPLEKDKDFAEGSYSLDGGTLEDQEPSKDLDALIMEMKALDNNEETSTESSPPGGSATTPSSVVTHTKVPTQQAQKESVFLRLSNKIKALERNMSLSGQYLEELSRRYKKQEELSRALNKTLILLRDEVRKSKDREQQRDSDLLFLRTQIIQLTAAIDSFQSEKDSWQHKAVVISQHFVLIVIEVVMFGVVVWMCRRIPSDAGTGPQRKWSSGLRRVNKSHIKQQHMRRRSSLDGLSSTSDLRKRRPSEEALKISGSYKDLLLSEEKVVVVQGEDISPQGNDPNSWMEVSSLREQRRRRKRRRDLLVKSSSSDNLSQLQVDNSQTAARKISAPLHSYSLPTENYKSEIAKNQCKLTDSFRLSTLPPSSRESDACVSEQALTPVSTPHQSENGILNLQDAQIPGIYMETATSTRNRRSISLQEAQLPFQSSGPQDWKYSYDAESGSSASGQSSRSKGLDSLEPVQTSCQTYSQSGIADEKKKKLNRKGGLKNMVKKFF